MFEGRRACGCSLEPLNKKAVILPTRKSVFVVDDDPSMLASLKRLLRAHGFDVLGFGSANELLGYGQFARAACVVLDIDLDGQSGIDLHRKLLTMGVTAPVIYITGNDTRANRLSAIALDCVACLTKPFAAQALIESVERACAGVT